MSNTNDLQARFHIRLTIPPPLAEGAFREYSDRLCLKPDADASPSGWMLTLESHGRILIPLGNLYHSGGSQDAYRKNEALGALQRCYEAQPGEMLTLLRLSPWLLPNLRRASQGILPLLAEHHAAKGEAWKYGVVLFRLTDLFLSLMEKSVDLGDPRLRDAYALLLRQRFMLLAHLHHNPEWRQQSNKHLDPPQTPLVVAWRAWADYFVANSLALGYLLQSCALSIETEGRHLLYASADDRTLWTFIAEPAEQIQVEVEHIAARLLESWYLPRYELDLVLEFGNHHHSAWEWIPKLRWSWTLGANWCAILVALLPLFLPGLFTWLGLLGFPFATILADSLWSLLQKFIGWLWLGMGLSAVAHAALACDRGGWGLRYMLPRVSLTILVGYLALFSATELIEVLLAFYQKHAFLTILTVGGSLLMAYVTIYVEVSRRLGMFQAAEAGQRARHVLLIGAARSAVIGWLLLVPVGQYLLASVGCPGRYFCMETTMLWAGDSAVWTIFPQLILLLAPLALFIGIVLETIWEDSVLSRSL